MALRASVQRVKRVSVESVCLKSYKSDALFPKRNWSSAKVLAKNQR